MNNVKRSFSALRQHQVGPNKGGAGLVAPEEVLPSLTTDLKHLATSMQTAKLQAMTSFRQIGEARAYYSRNKRFGPESNLRTDARGTKRRGAGSENGKANQLICEEDVFAGDNQSKMDDDALQAKSYLASQETALLRAATQLIREQTRRLTQRRLDATKELQEKKKNARCLEETRRLHAEKRQRKRLVEMRGQEETSKRQRSSDFQTDGFNTKPRAKGKGESRRGKKDPNRGRNAAEGKPRKQRAKKSPGDVAKVKRRKSSQEGDTLEGKRQKVVINASDSTMEMKTGPSSDVPGSVNGSSAAALKASSAGHSKNGSKSLAASDGVEVNGPARSHLGKSEDIPESDPRDRESQPLPKKALAKNNDPTQGVEQGEANSQKVQSIGSTTTASVASKNGSSSPIQ